MNISPNGLAFIVQNEGFRSAVYLDSAGKPTIGIGHLIKSGEDFSAGVTLKQATAILQSDVGVVETELNQMIPAECTQNQFDACCDFGFQMGTGALKLLLSHGWTNIPFQMYHKDADGTEHGWIYAGGKVVPGIVARRLRDIALFTS
jgi:lysozyme